MKRTSHPGGTVRCPRPARPPRCSRFASAWVRTGLTSPLSRTRAGSSTGAAVGEPTILTGHQTVSYTHLRAHETRHDLVCRLLLEKKKKKKKKTDNFRTKQHKKNKRKNQK